MFMSTVSRCRSVSHSHWLCGQDGLLMTDVAPPTHSCQSPMPGCSVEEFLYFELNLLRQNINANCQANYCNMKKKQLTRSKSVVLKVWGGDSGLAGLSIHH